MIKLHWNYRYVPDGQLEPDDKNRWMIVGSIKIDASKFYDHYERTAMAPVAHITQKGTANASFIDPDGTIPRFRVDLPAAANTSMLLNMGLGKTGEFYNNIPGCKKFAEDQINMLFDVLSSAYSISINKRNKP